MAESALNPGTKRIAVVTGANKGLGFEICRQLASNGIKVVLTARDVTRGNEAAEKLRSNGYPDVIFRQLDMMDPASISSLADFMKTQFGKLDILVSNAAIIGAIVKEELFKLNADEYIGANAVPQKELIEQTYETSENCLRTNYYGNKQLSKEFIPLLLLSSSPRIVYVSSSMGQLKYISNENARKALGDVDGLTEEKVDKVAEGFLEDFKENLIETNGWPPNCSAYFVSKAVLNAYARILARMYPKIAINAVHPGYVSTDINHNTGNLTVEEGAKGPVMLALMPEGGPSGLFFYETTVSTF